MDKKRFVTGSCRSDTLPLTLFSRKGQVTIFIILGLIFLLALALIIALKTEVIKFKPEELIPTEKGKIEHFITACIDQIGNEGLFRMGEQGGYIEVPADLSLDGSQHLRTSPLTVIPYWAYGPNTRIPSEEDLKLRLDRYMEENLRGCLLNLEPFQETYDFLEKSELKADTKLLDRQTIFDVHWDVEIRTKAGDVITELIDHRAESNVKLKRLRETAQRIVEREMRDLKLEDLTQDLIALEHPKVPVSGLEFGCSKKRWKVRDVRDTLKDLLRVNLRELRIRGTEYVEIPAEHQYYQNHYIWNLGENFTAEDVSVTFTFDDNFPFAFDVAPRSGSTLKSGQLGGGNKYLSMLCLQSWKFVYDVSYPVLVQLRDETSGYTFKIAFTVHLDNNIPNRGGVGRGTPNFPIETINDEEFCQEARIPMSIITSRLVDNDAGVYIAEPLEGVNITAVCLRYECEMGSTVYDYTVHGDVAILERLFPYCIGTIIRAERPGYTEDWKRIVTRANTVVRLDLAPLYTIPASKIRVVKHEQLSGTEAGVAKEMGEGEIALIKLISTKRNAQTGEPYHESSISLEPGTRQEFQQELTVLGDADFSYEVEVDVYQGDALSDDESTDTAFRAGYRGNWTISWDELQQADELVFHVVGKEKGNSDEQLELYLDLPEFSKLVSKPELRMKRTR